MAAFMAELDTPAEPAPKKAKSAADDVESGEGSSSSSSRALQAENLRKASFTGDVEKVKRVLGELSAVDRLLIIDGVDDDDGYAALHLAVIQGHANVVSALIKGRADVDVESLFGDTPLMWAAHQGNVAACKKLLRAGADIMLKNKRGRSATMQAQSEGNSRIVELINEHMWEMSVGKKRTDVEPEKKVIDAAEARRAANAAMVAGLIQQKKETDEEEAYWAGIRARREGREAQGPGAADGDAREFARSKSTSDPDVDAEVAAAALSVIPVKVRPHYKTLGAAADATEAEVRKLYRKLALLHHPDKNPKDPVGAKERFGKVATAYEAVCEYLSSLPAAPKGICIAPPKF